MALLSSNLNLYCCFRARNSRPPSFRCPVPSLCSSPPISEDRSYPSPQPWMEPPLFLSTFPVSTPFPLIFCKISPKRPVRAWKSTPSIAHASENTELYQICRKRDRLTAAGRGHVSLLTFQRATLAGLGSFTEVSQQKKTKLVWCDLHQTTLAVAYHLVDASKRILFTSSINLQEFKLVGNVTPRVLPSPV